MHGPLIMAAWHVTYKYIMHDSLNLDLAQVHKMKE